MARLTLAIATIAGVTAFGPSHGPRPLVRGGRPLQPGFLKDLGLEKPSWLPDFGGGKKEEEKEAPKAEEPEEEKEEPATADE